MESFTEAWELIRGYCKSRITDVAYTTWISRIEPVNLDFAENTAVLRVPNDFHRQTLERCYTGLFDDAFREVFGTSFHIKFVTAEESGGANGAAPPQSEDYEFTFETFIVGSSNKFAHAASMAVATKPATLYNPLFIYGNSGLGKTHLLYAICNEIQKDNPALNITYIKSEQFTNELVDAIKHGTTPEFRQKYRKSDVLLVDDIQFIGGKDSTQEEFFHTFNSLYEAKKQIVMTSDRPPKDIATLEDRLRTRFEWGLTADIQPPDFETRLAIIKRKAELMGVEMPDVVCEYIANKIKNNIRQLEGTVKKIKAMNLVNSVSVPNIAIATEAISDIINNEQPAGVTIERIIEEVGRTFGVSSEEICSSRRSAAISQSRQVSMFIIREVVGLSMDAIGQEFNNRDHSTVVYATQQIELKMQKDSKLRNTVQDIIKNIRDS